MPNVNDLTLYQASTVLVDIIQQATGKKVMDPASPGEFTSVATTALKTARDPIMNALSHYLRIPQCLFYTFVS